MFPLPNLGLGFTGGTSSYKSGDNENATNFGNVNTGGGTVSDAFWNSIPGTTRASAAGTLFNNVPVILGIAGGLCLTYLLLKKKGKV